MNCPDCTAAETAPRRDAYSAGCLGCEARALAATGAHLLEREQYREAVRKVFGDRAQAGHEAVKVWVLRMRQERANREHIYGS